MFRSKASAEVPTRPASSTLQQGQSHPSVPWGITLSLLTPSAPFCTSLLPSEPCSSLHPPLPSVPLFSLFAPLFSLMHPSALPLVPHPPLICGSPAHPAPSASASRNPGGGGRCTCQGDTEQGHRLRAQGSSRVPEGRRGECWAGPGGHLDRGQMPPHVVVPLSPLRSAQPSGHLPLCCLAWGSRSCDARPRPALTPGGLGVIGEC